MFRYQRCRRSCRRSVVARTRERSVPETVYVAGAGLPQPNLCIGVTGEQAIRGGNLIGVYLVIARCDVDNHELAFISGLKLRADVALVNPVAALRELLFTVVQVCRSRYFACVVLPCEA